MKMLENPEAVFDNKNFWQVLPKVLTKTLIPFAFVILPIILIDIYTTKAQKKASRVADMLALKELQDYRHYAEYKDNSVKNDNKVVSVENTDANLINKFKSA